MTYLTMNIEEAKLDIIDWIKKIHDERIIYKLEEFRAQQLDFKYELTQDQKEKIILAISTLEEEN